MTGSKIILLTFVMLQFVAANAWALPSVFFHRQSTDRIGPHSVPIPPVGDKVQIFAALDSDDPIESPTISVEARQGGTSIMLDPVPGDLFPIFEGYHTYYKFIDFDQSLTSKISRSKAPRLALRYPGSFPISPASMWMELLFV
jgi:hypothetical protein